MRKSILLEVVGLLVLAGLAPAAERSIRGECAPNEIIVKFRETIAGGLQEQLMLKKPAQGLRLSRRLDELNARCRANEITPVFKNFKQNRQRLKALLKKDKSLLTRKETRILRRLARAPKSAKVPDLSRIYKIELELEPSQSLEEVVAAYNNDADVEYAELNYVVSIDLTPNDPLYPIQWPLHNTGQDYPASGKYNLPPGTPDCDIDAPEAWDIETGSAEVVVAVVDTGVDYTHRDLQANMWTDGGGNYGYDFINNDGNPIDDHGHGTHCSGVIAAAGDNGLDIAGVCWNAKIMALKFLGSDGRGYIEDAVLAFYYAVENGAEVVSNSWGGGDYSGTAQEAINYAYSQGVIMVASAGNDDTDEPQYPAYYNHMISVAATDSDDQKASFSNYGGWVDIAAPGVDVLSLRADGTSMGTTYDDYMTIASGTSMACPHVAGAFAVVLSICAETSVDEATDLLKGAADPIAPGICQSGRLNLRQAALQIIKPKGTVWLSAHAYSCSAVVGIEVRDSDLKGAGIQDVTVTTDGGDVETVLLNETSHTPGLFTGTISTSEAEPTLENGTLQVGHGQIITVTYQDADDGTGSPATAEDSGIVDCEPPGIFNVQIDVPGPEPTVTFHTDEVTMARVLCGAACGGPYFIETSDSLLSESHTITITGVSPETDYFFLVEATDEVGNATVEDNYGLCYPFTTTAPGEVYVPSQYSTIQAAIDHSWNDGTVCVADGTYAGLGNRDIDFKGKAIHVRSENGPESCIIDCGASKFDRHCGFRFLGGEDGNSVLEGFTITNGYAYYGGGIYCEQSSPTIVNCILSENVAEKGGYGCGGGLYCIDSNMALVNCTFRDNTAEEDGGGMESVDWSRPTLTNCRFYGNVVSGPHYASGGGMHCCSRTRPVITNCIFSGNSACGRNARGGGLYSILNNIEVTNCIFTGNHADYEGGGMLSGYECNATITNCTFSGNSAGSGGGLFNYGNSDTALINCILWGNSDSGGMDESAQIFDDDIYVIKYCCIQGWTRGGEGNIDVDPCFVEPGYWDGDTWIDGDYHLLSGSACIDAGNSYYCMRLPCTDCHGYVRLVGERIDMGCYEFGSSPDTDGDWLADNSESGYEDNPDRDNDGILDGLEILRGTEPDVFDPLGRWNIPADADIIQEALFLSRDGEIIALSEGTYHQSIYIGGRNVTLTSSDPLDPNVVAATIINGDTDINPLTRNGPVIIFAGTENSSCQLRGLTITGGYSSRGAGIRGAGTAAGITYCTITGNRAYDDGGGVYGCAGPISYCTITSNQAGDKGGGIYGDQYDGPISNCTIAGNSAGEDGGGLKYCAGPITRCTITGNSAGDDGGGMHACDHARLTNCVITGNVAGDDGGGMYKCDYDTINNCTITGNSANDRGGGIYYRGGSYLITNCIIWNDAPDGPQIYLEDMDDVSIVFSNVKGGWEGQGNIDADPLFVDAVGGDYRLSSDSPCIDAGTNDLDVLPATDIEGTPRPLDGDGDGSILADMGAYEYWVPVEAPVIEVSTSIIRFSAVDDQANPDDQVLSIRNWGQGTLIWEITEDCPWLEISPRNGESTGEFDDAVLSVDVARLRPGDRSCVLTVSGDGAVNSPRMVKVSLDVQGRILELSSNEFRFSYGDSNPYDQTLFVWNAGPGTLVWQITEDCPWLGVAPTSGESSGEKDDVILSVDGNGMPVGDYYCALTVSAVDADNSPQTVDVILDIIGSIVSLSQDQFEFTAGKSSPRPLDQNLSISNVGFRTLNWEITIPAGCDWLQVSPMIGTCGVGETNKVVLTVHADGLDYGSYSCELAVSDPNAENSPQTVGVNLNVLGPLISIEPDSLEFVVPKNGPGPPSRILRIGNGGYDTLHWEVSVPSGCGWLQVYPVTGESGGEFDDVTVSVDTAGLACGMYSCAVTISAADAENSPQSVEVNLLVNMIRSVPTAEYPTVQAAIDGATNGDVVIVADGVYTGAGNRDIDFGGKAITVRSENGPANCIVDCQGTAPEPHRGFYFHSGEGTSSVVEGFTITGGYANSGGGMQIDRSSPMVRNCILMGNTAENYGGGMCSYDGGWPTVTNCTFIGNSAWYGGGMDSTDSGPTITNCIFSGNSADCGGAIDSYGFLSPNVSNCTFSGNIAAVSGGGIYNDESSTIISNCIFWGDTPEEIYVSGGTPVVAYCDVQAGWTGEGNISHDPLFVDAAGDDYHLLSGSPAIDAGNPASDWSKEPWPNGSRVNMGAYGNTAEAMRSSADFEELGQLAGFWLVDHPFIDVAPGPGGDGIVNFLDFAVLAGYWSCEQ